MGDALMGIVDHHRQMIAGRHIPARQDDVAPCGRVGHNGTYFPVRPGAGSCVRTSARFDPTQGCATSARKRNRNGDVEAQRERIAGIPVPLALGR